MQINIQTREIELDREEYAHIERQLRFGLTRYQPEVKRVDVVLSQEHSADRGHCQRTRIRIHCRSVDDLEVEDVERSLQDAVDRAVDRSIRAVRQRMRNLAASRRYG
jgi:ribosomal subunit interface protein